MKALASIGRRRAFFLHLSWLAPTFAEFEVAISRNSDLQQQQMTRITRLPGAKTQLIASILIPAQINKGLAEIWG
ncbi:hypothetical protein [Cupriavidus sp. D39]|uniref:hypothetical protein n=1 Tax=Cupriavidus sp. D39 TaxID=2997877 RepID=UPI00226F5D51|nr:hypothetical protein [Cupriavidus sp. D39]MCY0852962.1 hypothetical protein [Cupriavidus sp. D39]